MQKNDIRKSKSLKSCLFPRLIYFVAKKLKFDVVAGEEKPSLSPLPVPEPSQKMMIPPQIVNHPPAFHLDLNTN